jgi:adenosine 3'-phospho 5'-phosphosulfate transporter B3
MIGICFTTITMMVTGELWGAIEHARTHTAVLPVIAFAAIFGYLSVSFILLLIRHYGATNTEVVKVGGVLSTCTRPALNLLLLRSSV